LLGILVLLAELVTGLGLLYLYALLIAGRRPQRQDHPAGDRGPGVPLRLAVALPAHNEEQVIGATVRTLRQANYPPDRFDVHVVADFCDDGTAAAAQGAGAIVHERREGPRGRKGYALEWLLTRLLRAPERYDAILVFDADSRVDPAFLSVASRHLTAGAQVIQGHHLIANPDATWFAALADADMRLNNRTRNQAKVNLGLSARLMGDAMCFSRQVLERFPWSHAHSLTEDREYGLYLATQGIRVRYAPHALSAGQAASRWHDVTTQRLRWYGGVFELRRRWLRPLLASAWRNRNVAALDHSLELILPSFSSLALSAAGLAAMTALLALRRLLPWSFFFAGLGLAGLAVAFPFLGLLAERAPRSCFRALVYGPFYTAWRVWIGFRVQLRRGNVAWVRTRRAEETRSDR
jgi:1,2-diacylglycerol 3-beta-glucosyltransferase